jgi:ribosomal protein S18 acetylase RimI-like enzyme
MPLELRIACEADAEDIAALVNRAYRPGPQEAGWTHEANLVSGDRTTVPQVLGMLQKPSTVLLLCDGANAVACVHVQGHPSDTAYIGMLATDPKLQAQGLGKQMLRHAEKYAAEHFKALAFKMSVLSSRPELLAFYERRGYVQTGEAEEYPLSAGVGQPLLSDMHLLLLAKRSTLNV